MSVKVMSLVFERFPLGGNERLVALALADHAHDDGTNIYPGVSKLAIKTLCSERTVQRILARFVESGWLIKVTDSNQGRGQATEYCINFEWICGDNSTVEFDKKGDNLSPFGEEKRVTNLTERVTNSTQKGDKSSEKGDTAMSAQQIQPSVNHHITTPHARDSSKRGDVVTASNNSSGDEYAWQSELRKAGLLASELIKLGVKVSSMHPTLQKWVADGVSIELLQQCVAIARYQKPEGAIAPNYVDSILQDQIKPKKPNNAWMSNDDAAAAKATELGIVPKPGESWQDLRKRIKAHIDASVGVAA